MCVVLPQTSVSYWAACQLYYRPPCSPTLLPWTLTNDGSTGPSGPSSKGSDRLIRAPPPETTPNPHGRVATLWDGRPACPLRHAWVRRAKRRLLWTGGPSCLWSRWLPARCHAPFQVDVGSRRMSEPCGRSTSLRRDACWGARRTRVCEGPPPPSHGASVQRSAEAVGSEGVGCELSRGSSLATRSGASPDPSPPGRCRGSPTTAVLMETVALAVTHGYSESPRTAPGTLRRPRRPRGVRRL